MIRTSCVVILVAGLLTPQPAGARSCSVVDFGAVADGRTLCTVAIQRAVDACAAAGGGDVVFPAGRYCSGPVFLKSHVHVRINAGAVVLADTSIESCPPFQGRWEGIEQKVYASLFSGSGLTHVSITGRGILDGRGEVWWKAHHRTREMRRRAGITGREPANPPGSPLKWPRPRMINLYDCTNVLIRDLTFLDSPSWTIHPVYCRNVTVDNVTIIQPYESPNTDGINPESCRDVRIVNCYVDCGDDCVTIKSGYNEDGRRVNIPCQNIVVANCTFARGRSAVGIGSETSGGVFNVAISNCVFKETLRGLRIKSARGRGNAVENIRASNIVMQDVGTGISLDMFYGGDDETSRPVDETTPHFRNIRYSNITGTGLKKAGEIYGLPEAPMQGVVLHDIYLEGETGLEVKFVKEAAFHDMEINAAEGAALSIRASVDVELDNVGSRKPVHGQPVIALTNVQRALLRNCRAAPGVDLFLRVAGPESAEILLADRWLDATGRRVELTRNAPDDAVILLDADPWR